MHATWKAHRLRFHKPATTSRGTLLDKPSYFLALSTDAAWGLGECSPLPGLSLDDRPDLEAVLTALCQRLETGETVEEVELADFPALRFALETARLGLEAGDAALFPSAFSAGQRAIPINGLIWMADRRDMANQIRDKLAQGFRCIKLKIGALDFEEEIGLLQALRREYSPDDIEIRVDANGAFQPGEALVKLQRLAELQLHSIEQPIRAGQHGAMARLVAETPLPIALDEELIGIHDGAARCALLETIRPHYLILKPSLLGGLAQAEAWIRLARERGIGWWVTSALESNLGLNVLAQWTATLDNPLPQGLGTGLLYTNNLPSPLAIRDGQLHYDPGFDAGAYRRFFDHA